VLLPCILSSCASSQFLSSKGINESNGNTFFWLYVTFYGITMLAALLEILGRATKYGKISWYQHDGKWHDIWYDDGSVTKGSAESGIGLSIFAFSLYYTAWIGYFLFHYTFILMGDLNSLIKVLVGIGCLWLSWKFGRLLWKSAPMFLYYTRIVAYIYWTADIGIGLIIFLWNN